MLDFNDKESIRKHNAEVADKLIRHKRNKSGKTTIEDAMIYDNEFTKKESKV
jgi:predicted small metal-binding protein